jgi:hypothetical protein
MSRVALLVTLAAAALPASGLAAGAEPGVTIVDRTVECSTRLSGGVYEVEARAHSGIRANASVWKKLPFAGVVSGEESLSYALVWISAGRPSPTTNLEEDFNHLPVREFGTLAIRQGCRSSRATVALTTKGLNGGPAGQFPESFDCTTPRRVLVRVRATLEASGSLRRSGDFLRTMSPIRSAAFAVRTLSGKQLVYASVAASGKTRLFTGRGCFRD